MALRISRTLAGLGVTAAVLAHAGHSRADIVGPIPPPLPPAAPMTAAPMPIAPMPIAPMPIAPMPAAPMPAAPMPAQAAPAASMHPTTLPPASYAPAPAAAPAPYVQRGDIIGQTQPVQPALAAAPDVSPWSGFYFGPNIGAVTTHGGTGVTCVNTANTGGSGCPVIPDSALSTSGVVGGGQVGYMQPLRLGWGMPLLLGGEIDVQGTGASGSEGSSGPYPYVGFPGITCSCSYSASQELDWFSTARARLGVVPLDGVMVYGTAGAIFGGASATQNVTFSGASGYVANTHKTLAGPTAGGGVEVLLPWFPWSLPVSAKAEGLYYDLGNLRSTTTAQAGYAGNFIESKSFGFRGTIFRIGLDLRLGDVGGL